MMRELLDSGTAQFCQSAPPYRSVLIISPHPDDSCISAGALAHSLSCRGSELRIMLITDGSEATMPPDFLSAHGWTPEWSLDAARLLRGRIRVAESRAEALILGGGADSVRVAQSQSWHYNHCTPAHSLAEDLTIKDIRHYRPGIVTCEAINEIGALLDQHWSSRLILIPDPNDSLVMHCISTAIAVLALLSRVDSLDDSSLLLYRCLSSIPNRGLGKPLTFGFDKHTMEAKLAAVREHASQRARRQLNGGYTSGSKQFYDEIVQLANAETARAWNLSEPFAEEYGEIALTSDSLRTVIDQALRHSGLSGCFEEVI